MEGEGRPWIRGLCSELGGAIRRRGGLVENREKSNQPSAYLCPCCLLRLFPFLFVLHTSSVRYKCETCVGPVCGLALIALPRFLIHLRIFVSTMQIYERSLNARLFLKEPQLAYVGPACSYFFFFASSPLKRHKLCRGGRREAGGFRRLGSVDAARRNFPSLSASIVVSPSIAFGIKLIPPLCARINTSRRSDLHFLLGH